MWNYRLVKHKDGDTYGLHEVYYNDDGDACGMTERPLFVVDGDHGDHDAYKDMMKIINMIYDDVRRLGVFREPEEWAEMEET